MRVKKTPTQYKEKTAFSKFMGTNGLTHKFMSNYLNIPINTISKYSSGERTMPDEVVNMILANNFGWDTSQLNGVPKQMNEVDMARLQFENNELREKMRVMEATNERYLQIIEMLTDRLSSAVQDVMSKIK